MHAQPPNECRGLAPGSTHCISKFERFWCDCMDAQAGLNFCCSCIRVSLFLHCMSRVDKGLVPTFQGVLNRDENVECVLVFEPSEIWALITVCSLP